MQGKKKGQGGNEIPKGKGNEGDVKVGEDAPRQSTTSEIPLKSGLKRKSSKIGG